MRVSDKIVRTQYIRPKPVILHDPGHDLVVVSTPWGPKGVAEKTNKIVRDFYISAKEDVDNTSPFNFLMCLTPTANYLRTAVKMANDTIFREDNRKEFTSGIELFVIAKNDEEISYIQIGNYFPLLVRNDKPMTLGHQADLSTEFVGKNTLPPLPSQLLGIENTSDFSVNSLKCKSGDKLFLTSISQLDLKRVFDINSQSSLEDYANLVNTNQQPFWTGLIEL